MAGHSCERMQEVNKNVLGLCDDVFVETNEYTKDWQVTSYIGGERVEIPADYCLFCGKKLADTSEK
ncbi:hypothetical protein [Bacillus thuringiensis]|uniref:hypothetical protein n=1 Tax=Bacillus thuringiensis TaxID=1428 RepID=UPI000BFCA092|nr:hypothetical protein [Bacillus thuringiensis]PGT89985.1 hypothetical protein COD17_09555 [Bacillus thuringiensis]